MPPSRNTRSSKAHRSSCAAPENCAAMPCSRWRNVMQRDYDFASEPSGAPQAVVARIIQCGDCRFALPQHTTLEIVDHPKPVRVPGAASHALGLLEWQGRRIALIDATALLANVTAAVEAPR